MTAFMLSIRKSFIYYGKCDKNVKTLLMSEENFTTLMFWYPFGLYTDWKESMTDPS